MPPCAHRQPPWRAWPGPTGPHPGMGAMRSQDFPEVWGKSCQNSTGFRLSAVCQCTNPALSLREIFTRPPRQGPPAQAPLSGRSEEHTSELKSHSDIGCRLLLEKKKRRLSSSNGFEISAPETITNIIKMKLIRVRHGTVRHLRRLSIDVIKTQRTQILMIT